MDQRRILGFGAVVALVIAIGQAAAGIGTASGQGNSLKWNGWFFGASVAALIAVGLVVWLFVGGRRESSVAAPSPIPVSNPASGPDGDAGGSKSEVKPLPKPMPLLRRTPEELWHLFDGLTDLQAQQVVQPLLGQRMEISGEINSVGAWSLHDSCQVTTYKEGPFGQQPIYMMFPDRSQELELAALREGDHVTVRGELERLERILIQLVNCQLVESKE